MQWETAVYTTLAIVTTLTAYQGPSRAARWSAWLLFLSCLYCNATWYIPELKTNSTSLPIVWSYSDAAGAAIFTALAAVGPRPRRWKIYCAGLSWFQLVIVHPLRAFEILSQFWYAATLNLAFFLTCTAVMSETLTHWSKKKLVEHP